MLSLSHTEIYLTISAQDTKVEVKLYWNKEMTPTSSSHPQEGVKRTRKGGVKKADCIPANKEDRLENYKCLKYLGFKINRTH